VGSIVIGLLLVRHNRTKPEEDPAGASMYLYQNTHKLFGLESMAIVFSLPWALLMWSIVMLSIALLLFSFNISNISTRIVVAVMSAMVTALIVGSILTAWQSSHDWEMWRNHLVVLQRECDRLVVCLRRFILRPFRYNTHPTPDAPGDNGSIHSMTERRDGVAV